jgi:PadR family transcriptional regulator PadR
MIASAIIQLRPGVLAYCVIALVERQERYGLDLVSELVESGLLASEGTVYPLLARLRREGLVESRWQESGAGPPRRYYAATAKGLAAVRDFRTAWTELADSVDKTLHTRGIS